jgi:hypothetical protein
MHGTHSGRLFSHRKSYNLIRAASASCVGIITCNFGFGLWLHHLEAFIPGEAVSLTSWDGISALASKSLLDSAVWGTISNSINIFGRRLFAGDSVKASEQAWRSCILDVTKHEFKFWPFWQAFNFSLVPYEMQVQFTALGGFVWCVFPPPHCPPRAQLKGLLLHSTAVPSSAAHAPLFVSHAHLDSPFFPSQEHVPEHGGTQGRKKGCCESCCKVGVIAHCCLDFCFIIICLSNSMSQRQSLILCRCI